MLNTSALLPPEGFTVLVPLGHLPSASVTKEIIAPFERDLSSTRRTPFERRLGIIVPNAPLTPSTVLAYAAVKEFVVELSVPSLST